MAFTGQVLRFDQDAYWGLGIGVFILSRVPWMGGGLVHLLLGGPTIAGATLSRFFALHVFVIPGTLLFLALVHVWMVIKLGINEWPMPGRLVRKSTYIAEYNKLTHEDGIPFVPGAFWKDLIFSGSGTGGGGRMRGRVWAVRDRADSRIHRSRRRSPNRTFLSSGFTRCSPICRRPWRRPSS